jgi:hypothetical protein
MRSCRARVTMYCVRADLIGNTPLPPETVGVDGRDYSRTGGDPLGFRPCTPSGMRTAQSLPPDATLSPYGCLHLARRRPPWPPRVAGSALADRHRGDLARALGHGAVDAGTQEDGLTLTCIYGHAARGPVAQPTARGFGPARARHGPVAIGPGPARPEGLGRAWAASQARGTTRARPDK